MPSLLKSVAVLVPMKRELKDEERNVKIVLEMSCSIGPDEEGTERNVEWAQSVGGQSRLQYWSR